MPSGDISIRGFDAVDSPQSTVILVIPNTDPESRNGTMRQ